MVPKLGVRQGLQDNFKVIVQDLNTQIEVEMLRRGCRSIKNLANYHKLHIKLTCNMRTKSSMFEPIVSGRFPASQRSLEPISKITT